MDVSIIICTRNRAQSLKETLSAIANLEVPNGVRGEVLVVDNGSSDETRDVVSDAASPWGGVRWEREPRGGVAMARTLALRRARGDILLWTDDDVLPPRDWIGGMTEPIRRGECDAVAGGVRLGEGRLRQWMGKCIRSWLASSESLDPKFPGRMIGANMAFHRGVAEAVSEFDPVLGPGALGMGEETLYSYQLETAGFRLIGALEVVVDHCFDARRLSRDWLERIALAMGRSEAYIAYHWRQVDVRGADWRLCDAYLRWFSWIAREPLFSDAPRGVSEGRLQALSRVAYWRHLWALKGRKRKYRETSNAAQKPNLAGMSYESFGTE